MGFSLSYFQEDAPRASFGKDLLILSGVLLLLFTFLLGHRPLATPDEGRYVEIPREMVETGDFLTPRLNGLKYFEKPPLFYWMQAGLIKLFGVEQEGFLRLWTAFFGLMGCLMVYGMGRVTFSRTAGFFAAGVLGSSFLYFALSRLIILDMALSVFISGALFSFWMSTSPLSAPQWASISQRVSTPRMSLLRLGRKRFFFLTAYALFMACATLTKGLIGVVLPGAIILLWIFLMRQGSLLKSAFHPWVILLYSLVAAPWHIFVSLKNPEFFNFYFIHEHVLRYTTSIHGRYQPVWFFVPVLVIGFFPWINFLYASLLESWKISQKKPLHHSFFIFLSSWVGFIFIFFSFSKSKLIPYLLPLFPPLSLWIGLFLSQAVLHPQQVEKSFKQSLLCYKGFLFLFAAAALAYLPFGAWLSQAPISNSPFSASSSLPSNSPSDLPLLWGLFTFVALLCVGTILALERFGKGAPRSSLFIVFVSTISLLMTLSFMDPYLQPRPSMKPFAHKIKEVGSSQDPVVTYGKYYQDLPVYLGRRVQVVDWKGELNFGADVEPTQDRLLTTDQFWRLWQTSRSVFMITPRPLYERFLREKRPGLYLVFQEKGTVLLHNQGVSLK